MKTFKNLSEKDTESLLKFPAYVSLLAANSNDKLDEEEKKSAIKFAHIKTYSCDPLLKDFYTSADQAFAANIEQLDRELPDGKQERDAAIKKELLGLEKIASSLGEEYILAMHRSMKSFTEHVSKAHHNILVDFLFPLPIRGITY